MANGDDGPDRSEYQLRLFVSGATRRSLTAVATVRAVCEAALAGRYSLEVIDIYRDPLSARAHQVFAVPTLLKLAPIPKRMFVGDMSDTAPLFAGLGLRPPDITGGTR
jgi:circadian clock protein KaiB